MHDLEKELSEVTELISLPEVYLKVRKLMDDPSSDIYDFAQVISVDPNLTTRVLKIVNSAYFGFPQPVESIPRAVNMIGIGQLHNLVLGVSAISSLDLPNDILPLKPFWYASLYSGVLARLLAEKLKLGKSDQLFLAGLLHEIGHLVLCARFPEYAREAIRVSLQSDQPIHDVQQQMFGCHYGDIGAGLMANWNLPQDLQNLTRYHTDPMQAGEQCQQAALMHFAHACAHRNPSESSSDADTLVNAEVRSVIGLTQEEIEESVENARSISSDMERVILA